MDINNPIPREWEQYVTQTALGLEVIPDQLWDTQTYVDNTTTSLQFFATARGLRSQLGNMTQAGVLPNPESFLIQAPRIFYRTQVETQDEGGAGALASMMNDIVLLQNTAIITLTIGHKQYGPWRPWPMPAGSGLMGFLGAAGAEAANLVSGYANTYGKLWALFPNLMIAPLQPFSLEMAWPSGAVNTSGNVDIEILFDGQRARAIG